MRRRPWLAAAGVALAWPMAGRASVDTDGLVLRGQGTLRFLGLAIYEARLWVAPGFDPEQWQTHPLMLRLEYRRALDGRGIADRSLQEMRRGGPLAEEQAERWVAWMRESFPNVQAGDQISGRWAPSRQATAVRVNQGAWRELVDGAFGARFFGIWLAPHSSAPTLRAQLLGLR